jgi:hypothetical protein
VPTVVISFDIDPSKVGTLAELSDEDAKVKVLEGRARYANEAEIKAGHARIDAQPVEEEPVKESEMPAKPESAASRKATSKAEAGDAAKGTAKDEPVKKDEPAGDAKPDNGRE